MLVAAVGDGAGGGLFVLFVEEVFDFGLDVFGWGFLEVFCWDLFSAAAAVFLRDFWVILGGVTLRVWFFSAAAAVCGWVFVFDLWVADF